jgi:hypothetical protein
MAALRMLNRALRLTHCHGRFRARVQSLFARAAAGFAVAPQGLQELWVDVQGHRFDPLLEQLAG